MFTAIQLSEIRRLLKIGVPIDPNVIWKMVDELENLQQRIAQLVFDEAVDQAFNEPDDEDDDL